MGLQFQTWNLNRLGRCSLADAGFSRDRFALIDCLCTSYQIRSSLAFLLGELLGMCLKVADGRVGKPRPVRIHGSARHGFAQPTKLMGRAMSSPIFLAHQFFL